MIATLIAAVSFTQLTQEPKPLTPVLQVQVNSGGALYLTQLRSAVRTQLEAAPTAPLRAALPRHERTQRSIGAIVVASDTSRRLPILPGVQSTWKLPHAIVWFECIESGSTFKQFLDRYAIAHFPTLSPVVRYNGNQATLTVPKSTYASDGHDWVVSSDADFRRVGNVVFWSQEAALLRGIDTKFARRIEKRSDKSIAVQLNLSSLDNSTRREMLESIQKSADSALQQRDDEAQADYTSRLALGRWMLTALKAAGAAKLSADAELADNHIEWNVRLTGTTVDSLKTPAVRLSVRQWGEMLQRFALRYGLSWPDRKLMEHYERLKEFDTQGSAKEFIATEERLSVIQNIRKTPTSFHKWLQNRDRNTVRSTRKPGQIVYSGKLDPSVVMFTIANLETVHTRLAASEPETNLELLFQEALRDR